MQIIEFLDKYNGALMVIITLIYAVLTGLVFWANHRSAKASKKQLQEMQKQYADSNRPLIELEFHYIRRTWYYYEDICFAVFQDQAAFSQEQKDGLKETNDWNMPLDDSRMTKKAILPEESEGRKLPYLSISYERAEKIEDYRAIEVFQKTVSVADREQVYADILDIDSEDRLLIIVTVLQRKSFDKINMETIRSYFMIYDTNSDSQAAPIVEIESAETFADQLIVFKSQNAWTPTR